ncbi:hypothetical protein EDD30_7616 [Couchioplanes caeruleus]|uniref:Uncharacterized protein n=1 Tax=Couchioplanes caeruleus TaxID=56438 RepID=A0A3N1FT97_9ACTN|nr:hypothetical protein EDD30_7616 [Couchioplanes caeruleus]
MPLLQELRPATKPDEDRNWGIPLAPYTALHGCVRPPGRARIATFDRDHC